MVSESGDAAKLLRALSRLIRIRTGGLIFVATIGATITSGVALSWQSIALACAFFCLSSAGFAINDYYDLELDVKAHRDRPLPAGELRKQAALRVAIIFFSIVMLISIFVGKRALVLTTADMSLLILYSAYLKGSGKIDFLGVIITGLLCASIFLSGWAVGAKVSTMFFPMVLSFLFIVGREIILDMRDVKSDKSFGMKTIPALIGNRRAAILSAILFAMFVILSPMPYIAQTAGVIYLVGIGIVDGLVTLAFWKLLRDSSRRGIVRAVNLTKLCFIIGVFAVALGPVA